MNPTLVYKAIKFAEKKHAGQTRKATKAPYITHPLEVSYLIAMYKRSKHFDELLAAGILHDTLEDTNTTFAELAKEFTPLVASLVHELTSDPVEIKKLGKLEYLKKKLLGISSYALTLKLCDRLHNVSDHPAKKSLQETLDILNFLEKKRKLSNSQKNLVAAIREMITTQYERLEEAAEA